MKTIQTGHSSAYKLFQVHVKLGQECHLSPEFKVSLGNRDFIFFFFLEMWEEEVAIHFSLWNTT